MREIFTKAPKNGGMLHNVRINFPQLDSPKAFDESQDPKYSIEMLIPKSNKVALKNLSDYINSIIQKSELKPMQKSEVKKRALDNTDSTNDYAIMKDGDILNQKRIEADKDGRAEYADNIVVRLKKNPQYGKPLVVDTSAQEIPVMHIKEEILAGYYCNVSFSGYLYKYMGKQGFSMGLNGVQKVREAEVFGQVNPFEALEIEDSEGTRESTKNDRTYERLSSNPFDN